MLNFIGYVCSRLSNFAAMINRVDIQFKGLSTSPSDYACSDGELAICHNLENVDGELRPVMPPKLLFELPSGCKLVCLHKMSDCTRMIIDGATGLGSALYVNGKASYSSSDIAKLPADGKYASVISIGNILLVTYTSGKTLYFRWVDGAYKNLGEGLPELPKIAFGLHTFSYINSITGLGKYEAEYPSIEDYPRYYEWFDIEVEHDQKVLRAKTDEGKTTLYNALMGALERLDRGAEKVGAFTQPFFVRFAFRLYTGDVAKVSPAVLMIPKDTPHDVHVRSGNMQGRDGGFTIHTRPWLSFLRYTLLDDADLSDWEEIIESIDVFVSTPIYTYKQDYTPEEYANWLYRNSGSVLNSETAPCVHVSSPLHRLATWYGAYDTALADTSLLGSDGLVDATKFSVTPETRESVPPGGSNTAFDGVFAAPWRKAEAIMSDIKSVSAFYHVASIPLGELKDKSHDKFYRVPIEQDALVTLSAREALAEDYVTNYNALPDKSMVYNSRLLKSSSSIDLSTGFVQSMCSQFIYKGSSYGAPSCYVRISRGGKDYIVDLGDNVLPVDHKASFLFYPDPDAKELMFVPSTSTTGISYYSVPLKRHDFLQGAYWAPEQSGETIAYADFSPVSRAPLPQGGDYHRAPMFDRIYVSEVNNPFVFPSGLSATVGNGNIIALAATTLPISEGQQGQFPVMAFTDEGIWALSVSDTGSLIATNPMLRDVLTDESSLCVIDDGVVYATSEGLRILRGKQSTLITEPLRDALVGVRGLPSTDLSKIVSTSSALFGPPDSGKASKWADGCKILYSSTYGRLYVMTGGESWSSKTALVYNLGSGRWSSAQFGFSDPVAHYPATYVQQQMSDKTRVYGLNSADESAYPRDAVVLTRPMVLGAPDQHKTVHECIVRGFFEGGTRNKGDVVQVLYGSNDLYHWFVVSSSVGQYLRGRFGTPYKYLRLLVAAPDGLPSSKSIMGASLSVQSRLNNTLR